MIVENLYKYINQPSVKVEMIWNVKHLICFFIKTKKKKIKTNKSWTDQKNVLYIIYTDNLFMA